MSLIRTEFAILASIIFNIRLICEGADRRSSSRRRKDRLHSDAALSAGAGCPSDPGPLLPSTEVERSIVDMADTVVSWMLADRTPPLHADGSTNGSRGSKGSLRHVTREPPAEHDACNDSAIALCRRHRAEGRAGPTSFRVSLASSSILISTLRWADGDNNSNLVDAAFLLGGLFRKMAQE